jgi:hypothetical protein
MDRSSPISEVSPVVAHTPLALARRDRDVSSSASLAADGLVPLLLGLSL